MTDDIHESRLSIGELATRSGVGVGTLRMWEARHDFPAPARLPSGHRRYSARDVELVRAVRQAREEGLPLGLAIERARRMAEQPQPSLYAALRERFEHLHPQELAKPVLVRMSHAIEDECAIRGVSPVWVGCFQEERFYRQAEARWRALARSATVALVMADFKRVRASAGQPAEVPLESSAPLMREWVLVCDSSQLPACLVAWERPVPRGTGRQFEAIWTVEPDVVREAARIGCALAGSRAPQLTAGLAERLSAPPAAPGRTQLRATVELATRMALYVTGTSS